MRWLAAALAVLCLGALSAAGCGGAKADRLPRGDAQELSNSRSDLDDALDTAETLRTSRAQARRLRARARKIISEGSLEGGGKPDEFGLAALGRLRDVAPSLVQELDGSVRSLNRKEAAAFLTYAESDPARALLPAATEEVANMERISRGDDVGADTKIPRVPPAASGRQTVSQYLREAERDTERLWPGLSRRLAQARERL